MKMLTWLVSASLLLLTSVSAMINPIIPGFNPDPSIISVGDDFFVVTSTFEYFPGIPIYHSKDLIKWDHIGHALTRPSQLPLRGTAPSGGNFAPTIRYNNGTYYVIGTIFDVISPPDQVNRMPRSMYVKTTDIWDDSSWSEPIYVDQWGFDPDLFFDDDGKVYLRTTFGDGSVGHVGIFANWITEIDIETGNSLSDTRLLHETTVNSSTLLTEGSHLYKIDGVYHMITADSGTEVHHSANSYRASSLEGPWEENPNNPLIYNGADMSRPVLSTGHADIAQASDGSWWAVFLATRPQNPRDASGKPQLGRETFLCPVSWKDGWPIFNNNEAIVEHDPEVLYDLERPTSWRDDFDGGLVDKEYYYLRAPYKDFRDFKSVPGKLRLHGNVYTLSHRETPAALLRKQADLETTFSTELSAFDPKNARQEAGVTVYLSIHYHNEIAVTRSTTSGQRSIVVHTRTGPEATLNTTIVEDEDVAAGKPVKLYIEAKRDGYTLGYATGCKAPRWLASVGNENLQRHIEGWQNFVGTHVGIYSTGSGMPILNPGVSDMIWEGD
ncbi:family 43 glycosyl hydrolase [Plectosphaerella plurivora]|uniref:Family 43 glycosyl hydrolase n=1 Tax=Plectosphaerella plurivora TaxID=936078 RepID=A0A9P8VMV3_9PEZI|nr:family 43 glycosyl hydrolase [Plectosphaerella plurivora]